MIRMKKEARLHLACKHHSSPARYQALKVYLVSIKSRWGQSRVRISGSVLGLGYGSVWVRVKDQSPARVRGRSRVRFQDQPLVGLGPEIIL